jgi:hypothetical protein
MWRSNEPQVRDVGVGGHGREEAFLGKEEQADLRYYKGLFTTEQKLQRSFSAILRTVFVDERVATRVILQ